MARPHRADWLRCIRSLLAQSGLSETISLLSALRGEADMPRLPAPYQSDATDPKRPLDPLVGLQNPRYARYGRSLIAANSISSNPSLAGFEFHGRMSVNNAYNMAASKR
jgi:hypothetical protein